MRSVVGLYGTTRRSWGSGARPGAGARDGLRLMPSIPMARTGSSTERVEMPWT
ncbi:hypothetical protein [Falsiroseomonas sp. E2-1-a20]|uniref:hypothetical protein n=1 Tax=Falsiroseomonas sp. E2-1-a20 TaxID=3239300 RepID=UPI003F3362F2